jgi:hypothetical protein
MKTKVDFFSLAFIVGIGLMSTVHAVASTPSTEDIYSDSAYNSAKMEIPESIDNTSELRAANDESAPLESVQEIENAKLRKKLQSKKSDKKSASN